MKSRYLLAVDIGTSVSKVIVYDEEFRKITEARDEITTYYPQPHFFEQDPNQWLVHSSCKGYLIRGFYCTQIWPTQTTV